MTIPDEKKVALAAKFGLIPPAPVKEAASMVEYDTWEERVEPKEIWKILPGVAVGPLRLGMTSEQLKAALHQVRETWGVASPLEEQTDMALPGTKGVIVRYMDDVLFVLVRYVENRAQELTVDRMTADRVQLMLEATPVFRGNAGELAQRLDLTKGKLGYERPGLLLWQEGFREDEPFDFATVRRCPEKGESSCKTF